MDSENRKRVEKLKDEGNKYFQQKEYEKAISQYQNAMKYLKNDESKDLYVTLLSNICASLLPLHRYEECVEVANRGLILSPSHSKLLYRKIVALNEMQEYSKALEELKHLNPQTKESVGLESLESQIIDKIRSREQSSLDCLKGIQIREFLTNSVPKFTA